jgi:hypothetical protein
LTNSARAKVPSHQSAADRHGVVAPPIINPRARRIWKESARQILDNRATQMVRLRSAPPASRLLIRDTELGGPTATFALRNLAAWNVASR